MNEGVKFLPGSLGDRMLHAMPSVYNVDDSPLDTFACTILPPRKWYDRAPWIDEMLIPQREENARLRALLAESGVTAPTLNEWAPAP